ncbi:lipopolysaccharide biosynthesis protein [Haloplanus natans]|uniref:lipopolysaccharide biosynthesis protein n=1 Tax=Haloplanus natans TaxID=376171 RepID=UPI000A054CC1|nr:oligosaccharide flippase family protein [Haloplanus natans]
MTSLGHKLSTDVIVSGALNLSSRIRDIAMIPILTTSIGVSGYGVYVQLLAVTALATIVSSLALVPGYVNFAQDSDRKSDRLYYGILTVLAISSGAVGLLISLNAETISILTLSSTEYKYVFVAGGVLVPSTALSELGRGYYRAQMRNKLAALLQAGPDYVRLMSILIVIYVFQSSLREIVIIIVIVESIFAFLLQILIISDIGLTTPGISQVRDILKYSLWLTVSTYASQVNSRADRLLIGFFIGSTAVGMYSIAYGLASLLLIFVTPIRNVFFPEFSRLTAEGGTEKIGNYLSTATHYFLVLAIPSVVGFVFVSEPLFGYFMSVEEARQAAQFVFILGLGILFFGLSQLHGTTLFAARETKPVAIIRSLAAIGNVGLNLTLIPYFGVVGAAAATAITYVGSSLLIQVILQRRFPFIIFWRRLAAVVLSSLGMSIGLTIIPFVHITVTIFVGVLLYGFLIFLLGGVNKTTIKSLI